MIETDGDGGGHVRHGAAERADAELTCDLPRYVAIVSGDEEPSAEELSDAPGGPAAELVAALAPAATIV